MSKVACIGAGTVGRAWAVVFARAGYDVALYDVARSVMIEQALPFARETIELLSNEGFVSESVDAVLGRIVPVTSISAAVAGAVHVQESVREDLETKRAVFTEIAARASGDATLASSTSALPGSSFMGHIPGRDRALVAHPVNPPSLIPVVEICASEWTSPATLERVRKLMIDVGMKPVNVLKEIDGFILNRLQYTLVAEAMHLVGEGYCSVDDIETVVRDGLALRWASMGPFEVAHTNATNGFLGFVDQLGPMMKQMGRSTRTDYDWGQPLAEKIHARMVEVTSVDKIPKRQAWRNRRILATRRMQQSDHE